MTGDADRARLSVRNIAASVRVWSPFNERIADGLCALLDVLAPDAEYVRTLLESLGRAPIGDTLDGEAEAVTPAVWASSFLTVAKAIATNWPTTLEKPVTVRCGT